MVTASVRRLAVFKTVVDLHGVNAAAEYLGIAQPSVTAHIKALEQQVGATLFLRQRGRRHLRPTSTGDALYRYACEVVAKSEEFNQVIRQTRAADAQRLTITAQRVLANNVLPAVLADFLTRYPEARVSVHSDTQELVWQLIRSGEADVALLFARKRPEEFDATLIGSLDLAFIAAPNHPLAVRESVSPAELAAYGFVGGLPESEFFGLIREEMQEIGLQNCRFILHLQDSRAVKQAVTRNLGLACTFQLAAQEEIARGELVVLRIAGRTPRLPVYFMRRPTVQARSLISALVPLLERQLELIESRATAPEETAV